jgi:hypothetical protein
MKRRGKTIAAVVAALAATISVDGSRAAAHGPETIDLPELFAGEGVATGRGGTFYAGSRTDGRIARGDLREETSDVFVSAPLVNAATGLKADLAHRLLWVSGAATGKAAVYDLESGAGVATLTLAPPTVSFINDVVVTSDAAYFTNSRAREIYRVPVSPGGEVGEPETLTLSGPAATDFVDGAFNLNGIDATSDGRTLIVVNSTKGSLYTVDAGTGASAAIDLGGGSVPTGDGILLVGPRLLVMQNGSGGGVNQIAVVRLRRHLTQGAIVDTITSPEFESATTLARWGHTLVAVNAQFAQDPPPVDPEVVLLHWR